MKATTLTPEGAARLLTQRLASNLPVRLVKQVEPVIAGNNQDVNFRTWLSAVKVAIGLSNHLGDATSVGVTGEPGVIEIRWNLPFEEELFVSVSDNSAGYDWHIGCHNDSGFGGNATDLVELTRVVIQRQLRAS